MEDEPMERMERRLALYARLPRPIVERLLPLYEADGGIGRVEAVLDALLDKLDGDPDPRKAGALDPRAFSIYRLAAETMESDEEEEDTDEDDEEEADGDAFNEFDRLLFTFDKLLLLERETSAATVMAVMAAVRCRAGGGRPDMSLLPRSAEDVYRWAEQAIEMRQERLRGGCWRLTDDDEEDDEDDED